MIINKTDLVSSLLLILCLGALIVGTVAVLRPFLPAMVWSCIIVVATWPLLRQVEKFCRGRRRVAIALTSLGLLILVVAPVTLLLSTLITGAPMLKSVVVQWLAGPLPAPPAWLARLPFGDQLAASWQEAITQSPDAWAERLQPYAVQMAQWIGSHVGTLGSLMLEFVLTLVLIVVLYVHGETIADLVRRVARRIGGARGEDSVKLAAESMGAIAAGVVLTAIVQAILSGLGLWISGIPAAGVLTSVIFMLCVVQIGPLPIFIPAIVWLFFRGDTGWGIALSVWAIAVSAGDGFLRSYLIQRGAKMSFLLILAGVIGGLLAFGVPGIFIGPILLAVAMRLLEAWVAEPAAAAEES